MNRESYEQLIADAKAEATETMGRNPSPPRMQQALDVLATHIEAMTRDYCLSNLLSVEDAAQVLEITPATVRQILIRRNRTGVVGRKLGKGTWLISADELPILRQDRRRKSE